MEMEEPTRRVLLDLAAVRRAARVAAEGVPLSAHARERALRAKRASRACKGLRGIGDKPGSTVRAQGGKEGAPVGGRGWEALSEGGRRAVDMEGCRRLCAGLHAGPAPAAYRCAGAGRQLKLRRPRGRLSQDGSRRCSGALSRRVWASWMGPPQRRQIDRRLSQWRGPRWPNACR